MLSGLCISSTFSLKNAWKYRSSQIQTFQESNRTKETKKEGIWIWETLYLLHLILQSFEVNPFYMNRPVADWAKSSGIKQFLFISSAGIYKPTDEPPHVEGVWCILHILLDTPTTQFAQINSGCYRTTLNLMLVMLEWRNIFQKLSRVGHLSAHNTWSALATTKIAKSGSSTVSSSNLRFDCFEQFLLWTHVGLDPLTLCRYCS